MGRTASRSRLRRAQLVYGDETDPQSDAQSGLRQANPRRGRACVGAVQAGKLKDRTDAPPRRDEGGDAPRPTASDPAAKRERAADSRPEAKVSCPGYSPHRSGNTEGASTAAIWPSLHASGGRREWSGLGRRQERVGPSRLARSNTSSVERGKNRCSLPELTQTAHHLAHARRPELGSASSAVVSTTRIGRRGRRVIEVHRAHPYRRSFPLPARGPITSSSVAMPPTPIMGIFILLAAAFHTLSQSCQQFDRRSPLRLPVMLPRIGRRFVSSPPPYADEEQSPAIWHPRRRSGRGLGDGHNVRDVLCELGDQRQRANRGTR